MRKILLTLSFLVTLCLTAVFSPSAAAKPVQQNSPNLLRNPGFEGDFFAWAGVPEVQVAHEWTPWWIEDVDHNPRWHRPEWKRALKSQFPDRVLAGDSAQQYFTFYASHYAGMYQQVFDVTPGKTYRFSLWVQVWSSLEDNADTSVSPANPHFQIGIDPTGAALPGFARAPGTVLWSGEAPMNNHIDQWGLMTVEAVAQNSTITVYIRSSPEFANKHNDMYIDEASLIEVGAPVAPPPTNTPPPATATSVSVVPTATAVPVTNTPVPQPTATHTATAASTETPTPTETLTPPTDTPEATATHTATAAPTETPLPTETPIPATDTPEPTAAAEEDPPATAVANADVPSVETDVTASEAAASEDSNTASIFGAGALFGAFMAIILAVTYALYRGRTRN